MGMPANDRMDWLVEKATELGVASIQPLMTERSVLRLSGERADKKRAHWQAVAVAACEQCGRNRVPVVHPVANLSNWLAALPDTVAQTSRLLLSLRPETRAFTSTLISLRDAVASVTFLSGPEGGLGQAEEDAALARHFTPVSLGRRVLRTETAGLAALAALTFD
jgi:16S rRNA (uracil1498-N3)-methyltransferase